MVINWGTAKNCLSKSRLALDWLIQDVRYSVRGMLKQPGFVLTVILTVGVAVGINTAVFTLFNGYLLRPVAVRDPGNLYEFTRTGPQDFSWHEFLDLQRTTAPFSEIAALERVLMPVEGRMMRGQLVSGNYFQMLGVRAAAGRPLLPEDAAKPGGAQVAVLSYSTWERQFGRDPGIIGRKMRVSGLPVEVVGIASPDFMGVAGSGLNFWLPITLETTLRDGPSLFGTEEPARLRIIGRLNSGLAEGQARRVLTDWMNQRDSLTGMGPGKRLAVLKPLTSPVPLTPEVLARILPIVAVFALLLVVAGCNVATMLLARALSRHRELATRLSLGAHPRRISRQLLTESLVLIIPAGVVGFFFSQLALQGIQSAIFATAPVDLAALLTLEPMPPDLRPFAFSCLVALICAVFSALAPRGLFARVSLMQAARGELGSSVRPSTVTAWLLVGEVAVSVMLLVCAGTLIRNTGRVVTSPLGFRSEGLIAVRPRDKSRRAVVEQVSSHPGVVGIAAVTTVPFEGGFPMVLAGSANTSRRFLIKYREASPEYFKVVGIPLVTGRNFTAAEAQAGSAVVIVSQSAARRLWPRENPVGKVLRFDWSNPMFLSSPPPGRYSEAEVIGVAGDCASEIMESEAESMCAYLPAVVWANQLALLVRTADPSTKNAREEIEQSLNARLPGSVARIFTIQEEVELDMYPFRFMSWTGVALGLIALVLTLAGVYAILSHVANQRAKEVSIRLALGANPRRLAVEVIWKTLLPCVRGGAAGLVLGLGLARLFTSFLVEITIFDPLAIGLGCGSVVLTCVAAAYLPSRRTFKTSPGLILRHE